MTAQATAYVPTMPVASARQAARPGGLPSMAALGLAVGASLLLEVAVLLVL